ncbi:unnamed protein product [Brugia pahangi]|uniref:Transposase n=1 Tax=Brugia pahangi TaxID=6280 RepID=A0A0N4TSF3_BRUPA|nr:unnamed protein product [Brugia pahangi]
MEKEFLADGRHMNTDSARHRVPHRHTLQVMEKGGTVEKVRRVFLRLRVQRNDEELLSAAYIHLFLFIAEQKRNRFGSRRLA